MLSGNLCYFYRDLRLFIGFYIEFFTLYGNTLLFRLLQIGYRILRIGTGFKCKR